MGDTGKTYSINIFLVHKWGMKMQFKDKNLLIISNGYPTLTYPLQPFIKGQVDELKKYFNSVYVISPQPIGYRRELRDYSCENVKVYYPRFFHVPIELFRKRLGDNFFKAALRAIKRARLEFDLIHAHFTWPSGYAGVRLSKEFNVPVVITIHENRDWFLKEYNSNNGKIYWTWRSATVLIRVNKVDIPLLKKFNPNVYSIPNGFDPNRLRVMSRDEARRALGLLTDGKLIFSLGNLIERKGFQYLITAMKEIVKVRRDVMCFIGGSGPLKKELERLIKRLGLQDHIKLLDSVPDDELKYWMNAADLFVLPSLSEGNPTVMFEALGVGLPFIGTTVGGVPEIITSDDYGLLCPPKDPKCLVEKILIALEKEWDREKIRKYAEQFTWDNIALQLFNIYMTLTGER